MMETYKATYRAKTKIRADRFLAGELRELTRSDVQRFIKDKKLKINGEIVARPSFAISAGDEIRFAFSLDEIQAVPGKLAVRFENEDVLIVGKPAGVVVFPTRKGAQESLAGMVLANYPKQRGVGEKGRMGIVHRLDKDTSGLVVVAKTSESYDYLKNLFAERKIKKEYLALVYGRAKKHDVIESSLAKIGQRGSSRVRVSQEGKPAKTEYWAEKYYNASRPPLKLRGGEGELSPLDQFTLVRIELHTGRTHQIRVHFSDRGHPVMGDKLYGKPESLKLNQVLNRQFLHASRLEFQAPDRTWIEVESPLPEGLKRVLEFLSTKSEIRNNI